MALQAMAMKAKKSKDPDIPSTREALSGPHAEEFWLAMDEEIRSLEAKGTWEIVERSLVPKDVKVIPGTWTHRIKRRPDGRLNKFKSRWCFRGDLERDTYVGNPYSPLVGWPTVRAALLLAATHGWKSRQVDFTLAFCQSPQKREVFMELPQYYRPDGQDSNVVLRLKKSLYGQMDSPKLFYEHLCEGMTKLGFEALASDPCCFVHKTHQIIVLNYCDDQIWLSPNDKLIEKYVGQMATLGYDLTLEPKGDMFGFLGIDFKRRGSTIELTQVGLIDKVVKFVGLQNCKPLPTPALKEPLGSDPDGDPFDEDWNYAAAIGMLLYISSNTRPDIQFAVHQAARFSHSPRKSHGKAVKRIIRYLAGTADKGTTFIPDLNDGLDCYVDADFAGLYGYEDDQDPVSVKSRTGFTLTLFGCPIIWSSKLQSEITLSSTAAEYVAFSMAMRELLPMRALLKELSTKLKMDLVSKSLVRSTVFEDNQGCLSMVNVPKMSTRNKYLSLKYHFFRSHIGEQKGIVAKYIRSQDQKADILTKGLPPEQFQTVRKLLIGW
jgi:histone deacetylase 1/2